MNEPKPLQQIDRTYVRFQGRKLSYFSGCDYFRLASHPDVLQALRTGAARNGLNVAASRLTTGNHVLYGELERALADFFQSDSAILVPTGYLANLVLAQALAGSFSHALIDERAHPALQDGAVFLDCPVLRFRHRDAEDLGRAVRRCGPGAKPILLTDGLFAHDGSVAPLKDYLRALPEDASLVVDDAHGVGVLGKNGRGTPEHEGVPRRRLIQTITLSKAFGTYGGAILCPKDLRDRVLEHSRIFIGSTPLPLPLVQAALQALAILKADRGHFRKRLAQNVHLLREALRANGCDVPPNPGPIIALIPRTSDLASSLRTKLLASAIYPPFIKYPGGPANGYFRFVISSEHTLEQLRTLSRVLTDWPGITSVSF